MNSFAVRPSTAFVPKALTTSCESTDSSSTNSCHLPRSVLSNAVWHTTEKTSIACTLGGAAHDTTKLLATTSENEGRRKKGLGSGKDVLRVIKEQKIEGAQASEVQNEHRQVAATAFVMPTFFFAWTVPGPPIACVQVKQM
jgi:hypothetical protein